ncbi:DNA sulfur modification protein DndE [Bacillus sp. RC206]|uniref:DNA sulfur modification protein DndE n=1 Tax=Bacillus sp. RC206 TaxID=3156281 RepID=UPI001C33F8ED|nr:DNA sulfur modification protein DndE [Bacillus mycoides]
MNYRLKISKRVSDKLKELQAPTNLTPNILARLAVGLSLTDPTVPEISNDKEAGGLEINRHTLTGDYDFIYKCLITQHAGREVSDEEYFPTLFNAHLERGINLLESEYKHAGNNEKFSMNLLKYGKE